MLPIVKVGPITLVLTATLALAACAPKSKTVGSTAVTADVSGLVLDRSQAPTLLYKRPGAPTLADYDRFIIDPVRVDYSDPNIEELDPEDVAQIQQYFQNALINELRDAGYQIGTRSEAGTMRISLTILGLEASNAGGAANVAAMAAGAATGLPVIFAISVGEVTVEGIFREALTNRIDAVAVDRSQGSRIFNNKPWSTWADVEGAADKWAEGIRAAVEQAHGHHH